MIYDRPAIDIAIDQGDLIDGCPVVRLKTVPNGNNAFEPVALHWHRILVVTQAGILKPVG